MTSRDSQSHHPLNNRRDAAYDDDDEDVGVMEDAYGRSSLFTKL
jgi:hypothetical protein